MNDFQLWLISKGYVREYGSGAWLKDGVFVSGEELSGLLNEWRNLTDKQPTNE